MIYVGRKRRPAFPVRTSENVLLFFSLCPRRHVTGIKGECQECNRERRRLWAKRNSAKRNAAAKRRYQAVVAGRPRAAA